MAKNVKVDLTLLKKFVSELELNLTVADGIQVAKGDVSDYLVEMAKSAGLALSISQEATMLVGDINKQMMKIQNPSAGGELLEKLFGGDVPPGGPLGGSGGFGAGGFGGNNN
jgi:hypothetical protein